MRSHWMCQICGEPVDDEDGTIEIINCNIDHGDIGSHPVKASEDKRAAADRLVRTVAAEHQIDLEEAMVVIPLSRMVALEPELNIGFVVRHWECIADLDSEGYWFYTSRARTLDEWVRWVLHVSEKLWMGRDDLMRMLEFWWTHKGEAPPDSI